MREIVVHAPEPRKPPEVRDLRENKVHHSREELQELEIRQWRFGPSQGFQIYLAMMVA